MKYRALSDFEVNYPRPLNVSKGETLALGKRDTVWDGWIWVTNGEGTSAWMHESLLDPRDVHSAVASRDFSAAEISVKKGETVESLEMLGGWHWCRKPTGECGWIPDYTLEKEP